MSNYANVKEAWTAGSMSIISEEAFVFFKRYVYFYLVIGLLKKMENVFGVPYWPIRE